MPAAFTLTGTATGQLVTVPRWNCLAKIGAPGAGAFDRLQICGRGDAGIDPLAPYCAFEYYLGQDWIASWLTGDPLSRSSWYLWESYTVARPRKTTGSIERQPHLALGPPFINKGLFADNYLENRLKEEPEWQSADGVEDAFQAIKKLYEQKAAHFTARTNEAQTEHDFIKPVLDLLWN
jgi:hypothetical protein